MKDNVNHPGHYNIPGRKECIDEMLDLFGYEKVEAFCELNSYKYRYRHELKNGQEDLDKAKNYDQMLQKYLEEDPRIKVAEMTLTNGCVWDQLMEEMSELIQAVCKITRFIVHDDSIDPNLNKEILLNKVYEELADVKIMVDRTIYGLSKDGKETVNNIMNMKLNRTMERMTKNESN